jgi:hypothetical protein
MFSQCFSNVFPMFFQCFSNVFPMFLLCFKYYICFRKPTNKKKKTMMMRLYSR